MLIEYMGCCRYSDICEQIIEDMRCYSNKARGISRLCNTQGVASE